MAGPGKGRAPGGEGYILEFIPHGGSVKVTAVDPASGREVSIVGAASAGERALGELAVRKLEYVMGKHPAKPGNAPGSGEADGPGGILA